MSIATTSTSTPSVPVTEGNADFPVPAAGKPCKTWYKIYGDLHAGRPLVCVHGGPGVPHEYLLVLAKLAETGTVPGAVVFYDQIGNGRSTHLPEKMGDRDFWVEQLFLDELDNLLAHLGIKDNYALLGHSWGGMLSARHATHRPAGLKVLILSNAPASVALWEANLSRQRAALPQADQEALNALEAARAFDTPEWHKATLAYHTRHTCRLPSWPQDIKDAMSWVGKDPTVFATCCGANDFASDGSTSAWSIVGQAGTIACPTLLINGRYDGADDKAVLPYFLEIPKVKWVRMEESSHMPQYEETARYLEVVAAFLASH